MEKKKKIALFSPATPPPVDLYQKGIEILRNYYIPFKSFVDLSDSPPFFKAFLLYELILSGEFDFIWAVRGGFGSIKLIPYLENLFSSSQPNIFTSLIGFSDITALHLYFYKKFRKKGIHAPVVINLPTLSKRALHALLDVISGKKEIILEGKVYQEGEAEGILLGGNLITLASLCGTPYFPFSNSYLLFIEETNEKMYRLERAFLQILFTLGKENIKGLIIGSLGSENSLTFLNKVKDFLSENIPIGYDFSFGHVKDNMPLIIGEKGYLKAKEGKALIFQENRI